MSNSKRDLAEAAPPQRAFEPGEDYGGPVGSRYAGYSNPEGAGYLGWFETAEGEACGFMTLTRQFVPWPPAPPKSENIDGLLAKLDGKPVVGDVVLFLENERAAAVPATVVHVNRDGRLNLAVAYNGPVGRQKPVGWVESVPSAEASPTAWPRWIPR